jgi:hypothetical protein
LNAEISAILIRRSIVHLGLRPYIRRFKTEAGCTLIAHEKLIPEVDFEFALCILWRVAWRLAQGIESIDHSSDLLITPFRDVAVYLAQAGWHERAGKSSLLSGGSITLRLFTLSQRAEEGSPPAETTELLGQFASVKWFSQSLLKF